ncbi:hypothetical protein ABDD95_01430 [Mucilaginibacter sp. PAMB04274]|uniref:DUF4270 family protein n=1 Tax=Mucilaginibacter sp. PAMB04274 TaxID=3138568 RepID=UPI0031F69951
MKFIRLDLLTLLISLFILGSCKNQNEVGLPVGDQQLNGSLLVYDNIVVKTDTDNVSTASNPAQTPLASFNDPALGLTDANIASSLNLPTAAASYTVPTGTITTDSVIMELRYTQGFYGDTLNSRYKVNVYQLDEKPSPSQLYYANKEWKVKTTLLNDPARTGIFNARPNTKIKVTQIVKGGKDTLKNIAAHIRVPLNKTFIPGFLFNTPTAVTSNTAFQNATNGIYLDLERSQTSEIGGTMMVNLDSSSVKVYYRVNNAGALDTGVVTLPFNVSAAEVRNKYADLRNYSAEVKSAISSTTSNDVFYLQGLAGLRAKLTFPNVKTMFGAGVDLNTIAINRAELVITAKPGTDIPFAPQPLLTLYRLDLAKQRQRVPDANATYSSTSGLTPLDARFFSAAAFGGEYRSDKKEYHFLLTGYLQDLLKGKLENEGLYVGTIDVTNRLSVGVVDVAPTIATAGRTIAVGSDKSSPYRIKLNVIYTKNN